MTRAHWEMLFLLGAAVGLMLCFSLGSREGSPFYRWTGRIFWAGMLLAGAQGFGWLGLNPGNLLLVSALGWPGAAALMALSLM